MAITLNGLAQGYAADLALAALRRHGIRQALVDTSEYGGPGRNDGRRWRLGIRDPRRDDALAAHLPGVDLLTIGKDGRQWMSAGFPAA